MTVRLVESIIQDIGSALTQNQQNIANSVTSIQLSHQSPLNPPLLATDRQ